VHARARIRSSRVARSARSGNAHDGGRHDADGHHAQGAHTDIIPTPTPPLWRHASIPRARRHPVPLPSLTRASSPSFCLPVHDECQARVKESAPGNECVQWHSCSLWAWKIEAGVGAGKEGLEIEIGRRCGEGRETSKSDVHQTRCRIHSRTVMKSNPTLASIARGHPCSRSPPSVIRPGPIFPPPSSPCGRASPRRRGGGARRSSDS
jgi:hypothetical protein